MHDEYKADMKEDRQLQKVKDNRYKWEEMNKDVFIMVVSRYLS